MYLLRRSGNNAITTWHFKVLLLLWTSCEPKLETSVGKYQLFDYFECCCGVELAFPRSCGTSISRSLQAHFIALHHSKFSSCRVLKSAVSRFWYVSLLTGFFLCECAVYKNRAPGLRGKNCSQLAENETLADPKNEFCEFDLSELGNECTPANNYGYEDNKPCVLLKINKVLLLLLNSSTRRRLAVSAPQLVCRREDAGRDRAVRKTWRSLLQHKLFDLFICLKCIVHQRVQLG